MRLISGSIDESQVTARPFLWKVFTMGDSVSLFPVDEVRVCRIFLSEDVPKLLFSESDAFYFNLPLLVAALFILII